MDQCDVSATDAAALRGASGASVRPDGAALHRHRVMHRRAPSERDEAHHRIANSLALASTLLRRQRAAVEDAAARDALRTAETRLLAIAELHRRIGRQDRDGGVAVDALLRDLAHDLRAGLGLDCAVAVATGAREVELDGEAAGEIGVVVAELALNAAKHAYRGAEGGRLALSCRREDGALVLIVADRGPGLPGGFDPGSTDGGGLGLPVVAQSVARLGGRLAAHTDGGAVFTLVVPLDQSSSS